MKPSITAQTVSNLPKSLNSLKSQYNFIERFNIVTDDQEFSFNDLLDTFSFVSFRSTLDLFFTSEFIGLLKESPLLIKSIEPYSELTGISVTIDSSSKMHLTLSKSLDQSTGLDASKPLVDSALFDSSTRLLQFDLQELSGQKKRLERIQRNSKAVLSKQEYSCDFVAVVSSTASKSFIEKLSKILNVPVNIDESLRPKFIQRPLKNLSWPVKDEFDLKDRLDTLDIFEWIASALNPDITGIDYNDQESFFNTDTCRFISFEGPLIPVDLIYPVLDHLSSSSTRLLSSLKCCQGIPPTSDRNNERLKHFNEKKFDPTACTADQSSLIIFKTPLQSITFRLNVA